MLSKAPRYRGILAHAQAVDTRPTSLAGSAAWDRGYSQIGNPPVPNGGRAGWRVYFQVF